MTTGTQKFVMIVAVTALCSIVSTSLVWAAPGGGGPKPADDLVCLECVELEELENNSVDGTKIVDESIEAEDIATYAVGSDEIATDAVGSDEIATNAVGSDEIATDAVGSDEIITSQVQRRVIESCAPGSSISAIAQDGTVTCEDNSTGAPGTTLGDLACADGEFAQYDDDLGDWICGNPNNALNARSVFITQRTYTGNLGGVVGADTFCQDEADFYNIPGRFKAWLSTYVPHLMSPSNRFRKEPDVPYVMLNGVAITSGAIQGPTELLVELNRALSGAFHSGVEVWTNTTSTGAIWPYLSGISDCNGWTSSDVTDLGGYGDNSYLTEAWTAGLGTDECNELKHLYCFEQ